MTDVRVDRSICDVRVRSPNTVKKVVAAEHALRGLGKGGEQSKFQRGELDLGLRGSLNEKDTLTSKMDLDVFDFDDLAAVLQSLMFAQLRIDSRAQFDRIKRLRDEVFDS